MELPLFVCFGLLSGPSATLIVGGQVELNCKVSPRRTAVLVLSRHHVSRFQSVDVTAKLRSKVCCYHG
jgi:hypothetical protein